MEKIIENVYRCDGELQSDEIPLVLVHPWFEEHRNGFRTYQMRKSFFGPEPRKGPYLENLADLLEESVDRNIFLFEESALLEQNLQRINRLSGKTKGLYGIETGKGTPEPLTNSWNNVVGLIKEHSSRVDLAGGYLWKFSILPSHYKGCVGRTYRELKERGVKSNLLAGCCFC